MDTKANKIFALLLALCLVLSMVPVFPASAAGTLASYYSTNAAGTGAKKTITVDGDISDWDSSMLIAQGTANDDPRVYRPNSMYEIPIDMYALYGGPESDLVAVNAVPFAFVDVDAVLTIGHDHQVFGLIPLVVPVVVTGTAVHTAEDDIGHAAGNADLIVAVAVAVVTAGPAGGAAFIPEVGCETSTVNRPVAGRLQVQGRGNCSHNSRDHSNKQADQPQHSKPLLIVLSHGCSS